MGLEEKSRNESSNSVEEPPKKKDLNKTSKLIFTIIGSIAAVLVIVVCIVELLFRFSDNSIVKPITTTTAQQDYYSNNGYLDIENYNADSNDYGYNESTYEPETTTQKKILDLNVGETWVVDGQWEFTIDSVESHNLCNYIANKEEGYKNEQVIKIHYHYKNIGYNDSYNQGLLFSYMSVYDEKDVAGKVYPCSDTVDYAQVCPLKGTTCKAEEAYILENQSKNVTLLVTQRTDEVSYYDQTEEQAIFHLHLK